MQKRYVTSKKVLIVGFENDFHAQLDEFQYESSHPIRVINTPIDSSEWLNSALYPKPLAILCNYDFLELNDFAFLKTIRGNARIADVPLVTISHKPISLTASEALKIGIDDNFIGPVTWQVLNHRLSFLHRFKKWKRPILKSKDNIMRPVKISFFKRVFDILIATTMLTIMSPLLLLIAIGIKLESKGPVFYVSKRIGTNYRIFDFLKFRSMEFRSESEINALIEENIYETNDPFFHKFKNDPRVTRIGRILRKTSLDEIPQLVNVIKGEMSIVGNRPLPVYEARKLTTDHHALRFFAPAGITGLWQVAPEGKENVSQEQRINFDIEYAQKNTLLLDFKIIARTLPAMLQKGE